MNICVLYTAASWMFKGSEVLDTVRSISQVTENERLNTLQKTSRITTDMFFLLIQTASFGMGFGGTPRTLRLGTESAATGAYVFKQSYKLAARPGGATSEEIVHLIAHTLLRVSGVAQLGTTLFPEHFSEDTTARVKTITEYGTSAAVLGDLGMKINRKLSYRSHTSLSPEKNSPREALFPLEEQSNRILELYNKDPYTEALDTVRNASTIDEFREIPKLLQSDAVLRLFVCPITKQPIRFVVVVAATELSKTPVYYESIYVDQWIQAYVDVPPPGWPENLPVDREELIIDPKIQHMINHRLQVLHEEIKTLVLTKSQAGQ